MQGTPRLQSPKEACLDWTAAKDGPQMAYRWDGEPEMDDRRFVTASDSAYASAYMLPRGWLKPDRSNLAAQHAILDDREWPYYEHRLAAYRERTRRLPVHSERIVLAVYARRIESAGLGGM
jgi:hypothetical protein